MMTAQRGLRGAGDGVPLRLVMMLGWSEMRKPLPLNFKARGANKRLKLGFGAPERIEPLTSAFGGRRAMIKEGVGGRYSRRLKKLMKSK